MSRKNSDLPRLHVNNDLVFRSVNGANGSHFGMHVKVGSEYELRNSMLTPQEWVRLARDFSRAQWVAQHHPKMHLPLRPIDVVQDKLQQREAMRAELERRRVEGHWPTLPAHERLHFTYLFEQNAEVRVGGFVFERRGRERYQITDTGREGPLQLPVLVALQFFHMLLRDEWTRSNFPDCFVEYAPTFPREVIFSDMIDPRTAYSAGWEGQAIAEKEPATRADPRLVTTASTDGGGGVSVATLLTGAAVGGAATGIVLPGTGSESIPLTNGGESGAGRSLLSAVPTVQVPEVSGTGSLTELLSPLSKPDPPPPAAPSLVPTVLPTVPELLRFRLDELLALITGEDAKEIPGELTARMRPLRTLAEGLVAALQASGVQAVGPPAGPLLDPPIIEEIVRREQALITAEAELRDARERVRKELVTLAEHARAQIVTDLEGRERTLADRLREIDEQLREIARQRDELAPAREQIAAEREELARLREANEQILREARDARDEAELLRDEARQDLEKATGEREQAGKDLELALTALQQADDLRRVGARALLEQLALGSPNGKEPHPPSSVEKK